MAVPGNQGKTFHIACMDGDAAAVQRWLDAGLFVDKRDTAERTGLHQAAWSGRSEDLLGFAADINAVDVKGETPLNKAARSGMVETVDILLTAGADIDIRNTDGHLAGETFGSKVPLETRQRIITMRDGRRKEMATARELEEEIRLANRIKNGETRNVRAVDINDRAIPLRGACNDSRG